MCITSHASNTKCQITLRFKLQNCGFSVWNLFYDTPRTPRFCKICGCPAIISKYDRLHNLPVTLMNLFENKWVTAKKLHWGLLNIGSVYLVRAVGRATMKLPWNRDNNKLTFTRQRFKFKALFQRHAGSKPLSVTVNYHSRVNHFDDHCRVSGLFWNVV
jgi:hypothetical protein